jgi:hypothetical protein
MEKGQIIADPQAPDNFAGRGDEPGKRAGDE